MTERILYQMRQQQLERTQGELRALVSLHYDPNDPKDEKYRRVEEMVESFIEELRGEVG